MPENIDAARKTEGREEGDGFGPTSSNASSINVQSLGKPSSDTGSPAHVHKVFASNQSGDLCGPTSEGNDAPRLMARAMASNPNVSVSDKINDPVIVVGNLVSSEVPDSAHSEDSPQKSAGLINLSSSERHPTRGLSDPVGLGLMSGNETGGLEQGASTGRKFGKHMLRGLDDDFPNVGQLVTRAGTQRSAGTLVDQRVDTSIMNAPREKSSDETSRVPGATPGGSAVAVAHDHDLEREQDLQGRLVGRYGAFPPPYEDESLFGKRIPTTIPRQLASVPSVYQTKDGRIVLHCESCDMLRELTIVGAIKFRPRITHAYIVNLCEALNMNFGLSIPCSKDAPVETYGPVDGAWSTNFDKELYGGSQAQRGKRPQAIAYESAGDGVTAGAGAGSLPTTKALSAEIGQVTEAHGLRKAAASSRPGAVPKRGTGRAAAAWERSVKLQAQFAQARDCLHEAHRENEALRATLAGHPDQRISGMPKSRFTQPATKSSGLQGARAFHLRTRNKSPTRVSGGLRQRKLASSSAGSTVFGQEKLEGRARKPGPGLEGFFPHSAYEKAGGYEELASQQGTRKEYEPYCTGAGPRGSGPWAGGDAFDKPPNDDIPERAHAAGRAMEMSMGDPRIQRLAPVTSLGGRDPAFPGGIEPSEYFRAADRQAALEGKPDRSSGLRGDWGLGTQRRNGENAESMEGRAREFAAGAEQHGGVSEQSAGRRPSANAVGSRGGAASRFARGTRGFLVPAKSPSTPGTEQSDPSGQRASPRTSSAGGSARDVPGPSYQIAPAPARGAELRQVGDGDRQPPRPEGSGAGGPPPPPGPGPGGNPEDQDEPENRRALAEAARRRRRVAPGGGGGGGGGDDSPDDDDDDGDEEYDEEEEDDQEEDEEDEEDEDGYYQDAFNQQAGELAELRGQVAVLMAQGGGMGAASQALVQVSTDMVNVMKQNAETAAASKTDKPLQSTSDLKAKAFTEFPTPPSIDANLLERFDRQVLWEEKVEMELSQCFPFDAQPYWERNCIEAMECYIYFVQQYCEFTLQSGLNLEEYDAGPTLLPYQGGNGLELVEAVDRNQHRREKFLESMLAPALGKVLKKEWETAKRKLETCNPSLVQVLFQRLLRLYMHSVEQSKQMEKEIKSMKPTSHEVWSETLARFKRHL